ncbi:MAG: glutaminyl-peptide cyclotransferase [Bacteroidia bacterium]
MKLKILFPAVAIALTSCSSHPEKNETQTTTATAKEETVPEIIYDVIRTLPHDTLSFTEGFLFHDGQLFESTGSPTDMEFLRSVFGPVDTTTGKISVKAELDRKTYFGEGIVFLKDKVYQLTYKNQIGFIYDAKTFKQTGRFSFNSKEGWGMTTDGTSIIMSDGTNMLTYIDPATMKESKKVNVTNAGYAEDYINELEYINGYIYANVLSRNYIIKIDPSTGKVCGLLNLANIAADADAKNPNCDVLNGIAFNPASGNVYVTGKMYKDIYVIRFKH